MIVKRKISHKVFNVVIEGNSIPAYQGVTEAQGFFSIVINDASISSYLGATKKNIAIGGTTTQQCIDRMSANLVPLKQPYASNVAIFFEVRNDLVVNNNAADAYSRLKEWCSNARGNGFYVIVVNQTPSTGGTPAQGQAQLEIQRQQVRSWVLADFPNSTPYSLVYEKAPSTTYADLCIDVGGDTVMGDVANCAGANYQDGTHPSVAGHALIAQIVLRGLQYYNSIT